MIRRLAALFGITTLFMASATVAAPHVLLDAQKVIAGTGVRVRAAPDATSSEKGKLSIGTTVTVTQRTADKRKIGINSDYWYQLSSPVSGWVFGSLLRDFDRTAPDSAWLGLIREKLGAADTLHDYEHPSTLSFGDAVEISEFARAVAPKTHDKAVRGELELAYWRAVQIALRSGNFDAHEKPPQSTWRKTLGDDVIYSDPSAEYLIRPDLLWDLADHHKHDASGEVIAWQAANAYVGGECEGFISCVSARSLDMEGGYLKRYPQGKYVDQALAEANEVLGYMAKEWDNQKDEPGEVDLKEWSDMLAALPDSAAANTARKYLKALQAKH